MFSNWNSNQATKKTTTVVRKKSLHRPDRAPGKVPLLRPNQTQSPPLARIGATTLKRRIAGTAGQSANSSFVQSEKSIKNGIGSSPFDGAWAWSAKLLTCCICSGCLSCVGKKDSLVQQAWREKVASCILICLISGIVGFLTFGLTPVLCPEQSRADSSLAFFNQTDRQSIPYRDEVIVNGILYPYGDIKSKLSSINIILTDDWHGQDITALFSQNIQRNCLQSLYLNDNTQKLNCSVPNRFPQSLPLTPSSENDCPSLSLLNGIKPKGRLFFTWKDIIINAVGAPNELFAFNGAVVNFTSFKKSFEFAKIENNSNFNQTFISLNNRIGKDATRFLISTGNAKMLSSCLVQTSVVGYVDQQTTGCVASNIIILICMIVILGVVFVRLIMALGFHLFMSDRLVKGKKLNTYHRHSHQNFKKDILLPTDSSNTINDPQVTSSSALQRANDSTTIGSSPNVIILVTCYSEGEKSIRGTLESLAATDYPDQNKLLFVIADGVITGSGNDESTPDIILSMLEHAEEIDDHSAKNYLAIAHGSKQHNMGRVYAGYFKYMGRRTPMVVIVKCGAPEERNKPKPGNRGKRDSQLVLMNFLSRTLFDDRMTALDFDLYKKIKVITGGLVPIDYNYVLMVDADTIVQYDSLHYMIQAMTNDDQIMGLCGETRIENKQESWVTAIQVFEYFISHHLGKAFESVFGGVTCLPGCFCMYRIKGRKGKNSKSMVPLLASPDIVDEYSENVVDSLHKKNLLLLGEDRFLTTLMLRNFPKRKLVFVPRAICRTTVPDNFKVLLSQRRRWINSTIHNLFELVKLRDLCGIFCFSMQFVVGLELIGTAVLPAAISFTIYMLANLIFTGVTELSALILLIVVLFVPGLIIVFTTGKPTYFGWMLVYMFALPVWNFVLPLYAFWHFDDFSWGETRKVEGEVVHVDHSKRDGKYKVGAVTLRHLKDWIKHDRNKTLRKERKETLQKQQSMLTMRPGGTDGGVPNLQTKMNCVSANFGNRQGNGHHNNTTKTKKKPSTNYLDISLPSMSASYSVSRPSQIYSVMSNNTPSYSQGYHVLSQQQQSFNNRHSIDNPYYQVQASTDNMLQNVSQYPSQRRFSLDQIMYSPQILQQQQYSYYGIPMSQQYEPQQIDYQSPQQNPQMMSSSTIQPQGQYLINSHPESYFQQEMVQTVPSTSQMDVRKSAPAMVEEAYQQPYVGDQYQQPDPLNQRVVQHSRSQSDLVQPSLPNDATSSFAHERITEQAPQFSLTTTASHPHGPRDPPPFGNSIFYHDGQLSPTLQSPIDYSTINQEAVTRDQVVETLPQQNEQQKQQKTREDSPQANLNKTLPLSPLNENVNYPIESSLIIEKKREQSADHGNGNAAVENLVGILSADHDITPQFEWDISEVHPALSKMASYMTIVNNKKPSREPLTIEVSDVDGIGTGGVINNDSNNLNDGVNGVEDHEIASINNNNITMASIGSRQRHLFTSNDEENALGEDSSSSYYSTEDDRQYDFLEDDNDNYEAMVTARDISIMPNFYNHSNDNESGMISNSNNNTLQLNMKANTADRNNYTGNIALPPPLPPRDGPLYQQRASSSSFSNSHRYFTRNNRSSNSDRLISGPRQMPRFTK